MMTWLAFVLLATHLLCAHLATGGPLVAVFWDWRANRLGNAPQLDDGRRLVRVSLWALAMTGVMGVALGVFRFATGSNYELVWQVFHQRITWGLVEVLFSAVILIGYTVTYPKQLGRPRFMAAAHRLLAIVATTSLMYHLPPLFATIADASRETPAEMINADQMRASVRSLAGLAKSVHFSLAALYVAGIWQILTARTRESVQSATRISIGALALQLPVGFWLLTTLPAGELRLLMGGNPLHLALLIGALLASVMVLFQLLELAADVSKRQLQWRVGITSLCLLLAMIALLL